jgi:hypothetical protein
MPRYINTLRTVASLVAVPLIGVLIGYVVAHLSWVVFG